MLDLIQTLEMGTANETRIYNVNGTLYTLHIIVPRTAARHIRAIWSVVDSYGEIARIAQRNTDRYDWIYWDNGVNRDKVFPCLAEIMLDIEMHRIP